MSLPTSQTKQPGRRSSRLAFPDGDHPPAETTEFAHVTAVTFDIAAKLFVPKGYARLRRVREFASFMSVPEASVNKHHRTVLRQYDVRPSGKVLPMQAESVAGPVQRGADR